MWNLIFGLIFASFVRFHYKRGQQQKQRQDAELSYAVKQRRHVTPSSSFSNHVTTSPAMMVNLDTQRLLTLHHAATNDVRNHHHHRPSSRGLEDGHVMKRAPVVYMFNANGSMVDVRCDQLEICNTFRLDNDYATDDQQHIDLHSADLDLGFDLEHIKDEDVDRSRSCLKDPLTSRSSDNQTMDGELPQSNHHHRHQHFAHSSSQLRLNHLHHHYQQQQPQQQQQQQQQSTRQHRLSPLHHRYRHRRKASYTAAPRTSLLHPTRLGREYLASSDEELSRSAAAAEALMLWQKRW